MSAPQAGGNRHATGPDPLTPEQRRLNMSRIRGKNTKPELLIRKGLHARGLRYRLHDRALPGTPDLVFPGRRAVIFVHGCFWHGHDCPLCRTPGTRAEFWAEKISKNRTRDAETTKRLLDTQWRVLTIWECSVRGRSRRSPKLILDAVERWLNSSVPSSEIVGQE